MRDVVFIDGALDDLREFPPAARREGGHQIDRVQHGMQPDDWKAMPTIGKGVAEIRIRDESGAYRIIYVARFAGVVHVLHCFMKKTQKTSKRDLDLAKARYRKASQENTQ